MNVRTAKEGKACSEEGRANQYASSSDTIVCAFLPSSAIIMFYTTVHFRRTFAFVTIMPVCLGIEVRLTMDGGVYWWGFGDMSYCISAPLTFIGPPSHPASCCSRCS